MLPGFLMLIIVKCERVEDRMVKMEGTGIADFDNYQPPWSVNYAVIEKWLSGKDQIQSSARKNVFKD